MSPVQEEIQYELDRRRPGQSKITTPRKETDTCELLSGMAPDGTTTLGSPICVLVRNKDQKSQDYTEMELAYRPSHAGGCSRCSCWCHHHWWPLADGAGHAGRLGKDIQLAFNCSSHVE